MTSMNIGIVLTMFGVVIVHLSEAIFPIIFDCCTEVAHQVPRKWLRTVEKFDIQEDGGICKISAVILHKRNKRFCMSPQNKHVRRWMKWKIDVPPKIQHHGKKKKKPKRLRKLAKMPRKSD